MAEVIMNGEKFSGLIPREKIEALPDEETKIRVILL